MAWMERTSWSQIPDTWCPIAMGINKHKKPNIMSLPVWNMKTTIHCLASSRRTTQNRIPQNCISTPAYPHIRTAASPHNSWKWCCSPYYHDTSSVQIASVSPLVCRFGHELRIWAYGSGIGHRFVFGDVLRIQAWVCLRRLVLASGTVKTKINEKCGM